ncbi:MaoC-like domain-containing protein [Frankia sp. AgKG'84/4]
MSAPAVLLGSPLGPFAGALDPDLLRRYAEATADPSPRVRLGEVAPPVALVTQIWAAQNAGLRAAVPAEVSQAATGGVHGEHDIVLHRPIRPGEPLRIWVEGQSARPAGRNSLVTLRHTIRDAADALVAEQWWTTVFLGTTCARAGEPPAEHTFPAAARERPVATWEAEVDEGMAARYAEVSGDHSAHHFDADAARRSGFDRVFLHGLCTMALCAQGVVERVAGGDPARVRRIAVRFATPTFLGERLRVRYYDAGPLGYAFEADSGGTPVITHGRAELR